MSRFRAGAARRSARLCCDEVDGSRVARNRSSTPLPRPPVGSLAGRRGSRARRTALELAASAGRWQRPAAQGVRTGARSGFRRWFGRLDLALPACVRDRLVRCTGLTPGAVGGMTLAGAGARALLLPLRADLSPGRRGRRQSAWLQFCPQCLAEDEQPYFRRQWRLATTIVCARHGSRLLDRCPACGQGLAPFNQASLRPQNDCAACGFDLASAKAPRPARAPDARRQIWRTSADA